MVMRVLVPVLLIRSYRAVPERVRRCWSFGTAPGSAGTSAMALRRAYGGDGWSAIAAALAKLASGSVTKGGW